MNIILKSQANIEFRFVVALYSEALPIIEYYKLKLFDYTGYSNNIYRNECNTIWLVLSGIGNKKAAKAVNILYKISNYSQNSLWVNIGIAGHKSFNLGQLYEIKKITYIKNKDSLYFSNSLLSYFDIHEACSVDTPKRVFNDNYIYDMESYGFIKSVEKFCMRENICVLKIISDNSKNELVNYKSCAYEYIKKKIEIINEGLSNYSKVIKIKYIEYASLIKLLNEKYHVTFYNNKKIQNLMPQLMVIIGNNLIKKEIDSSESLRSLINSFEEKLKNYILKI